MTSQNNNPGGTRQIQIHTLNNQLEIDETHPKRVQILRQHHDDQRISEKNELERQTEQAERNADITADPNRNRILQQLLMQIHKDAVITPETTVYDKYTLPLTSDGSYSKEHQREFRHNTLHTQYLRQEQQQQKPLRRETIQDQRQRQQQKLQMDKEYRRI